MSPTLFIEGGNPIYASFSDLPEYVVYIILLNLDMKSLVQCRQVCKTLKQSIDGKKSLQYLVELGVAAMEHNPKTQLPLADCLEMLWRYQKAWNNLEFDRRNPLILNMLDGDLWKLNGGVLAQFDTNNAFHCLQLPSVSRNIAKKDWTVPFCLNESICEFGMDPSQDLLVWITRLIDDESYLTVHFRTLGTGESHPKATIPSFRFNDHSWGSLWTIGIRIMQDYVAVHIEGDAEYSVLHELAVWDWKKGERELAINTQDSIRSFTFLSERYIVATVGVDASPIETDLSLEIIDFKTESNEMKALTNVEHVLTLCYPKISDPFVIETFEISSEPSPGWTPGESAHVTFYHARDNRIFVTSLCVQSHVVNVCLMHIIPSSTFTHCIEQVDLSTKPVLQWLDWAPDNTYFNKTKHASAIQEHYPLFPYGSRFVENTATQSYGFNGAQQTFSLDCYNFNFFDIRKNDLEIYPPESLNLGDPFKEHVQTRLLFAGEKRHFPAGSPGHPVMCSADNVVLVDMHNRQYKIFTL